MTEPCPICGETTSYVPITPDLFQVTCPRCSEYGLTGSAIRGLSSNNVTPRQRANISGWLNENRGYTIYGHNELNPLVQIKTPNFHERADKLLLKLEKNTEYAGQYIAPDNSWIAWAWCLNDQELGEILEYLISVSRLAFINTALPQGGDIGRRYKIAAEGWEHIEKLKTVNVDSHQGFVAMWFNEEMQAVFDNTISGGILDAGYKPYLVSMREHNDKIDDEIIAQIRRSRFVLADFTGHRGGVYFEAGFAKGMHLEVVWTCRRDHIDDLHFDIRQYNCIDWEPDNLPEFRKRITNRIESVLGRGTYRRD